MMCLVKMQAERDIFHIQISLRAIVPVLPRTLMERTKLEEDL